MTGPDASSSELMVAVQAAIVDRATARVVTALRDEGVRSILLKGPVLADWLYADSPRAYLDADLLVTSADVSRAEAVLDGLGYAKVLGDADIPPFNRQLHAHTWCPPRVTSIDLHRTLAGALATPATVWAVLSQDAVMAEVDGTGVEVLGPEARSVMVVLHAAHHGAGEHKPLEDLSRALQALDGPGLAAAAELAERLDACEGIRRGTEDAPRRCGAGRRTRPAGALVGGGGASDRCAPPACPAHRMDAPGTRREREGSPAPAASVSAARLHGAWPGSTWPRAALAGAYLLRIAPPPDGWRRSSLGDARSVGRPVRLARTLALQLPAPVGRRLEPVPARP